MASHKVVVYNSAFFLLTTQIIQKKKNKCLINRHLCVGMGLVLLNHTIKFNFIYQTQYINDVK